MTSKDRQRQNERERYERVQARMAQQREAARKRNIIAGIVSAVAVVAIFVAVVFITSTKDDKKTNAAANPTTAPTTPAATTPSVKLPLDGCTMPSASAKANTALSWKTAPAMTIDKTKKYTMTIKTNCGDIVIALDAAKAPQTVNSFDFLAAQKFFDNSYCHRLANSAGGLEMLQCGDPTKNPANPQAGDGPGPGYTIPDENLTGATYKAGTVAMANSGPNTNGSQFFLVYGDSQLGPNYTPFGTITKGLDILQKIGAAGVSNPGQDGTGYPNQPVMLESVTVAAS